MFDAARSDYGRLLEGETVNRTEVFFDSAGTRCAAWLYTPEQAPPTPCVVMAHGFGAVREASLDPYARRFADAGMTVLVFDYRYFGHSEGEPRQLLDIGCQLEDWQAAIAYARGLDGVDSQRIGLWGTSFSGGHVIQTAARDGDVKAVAAQVPFLDGIKTVTTNTLGSLARLIAAGARDELSRLRHGEPHYVPLVAEPGELGAMTTPDAKPGYMALLGPDAQWENKVCGRIFLRIASYRPISHVRQVRCPLLICACEQDLITPPESASKAADLAEHAQLERYPGGHFDIYFGEVFEKAVVTQTEFFTHNLGI